MCLDVLNPKHGMSPEERRARLLEEWTVDADGLPVMTGLNFARAVFELLGASLSLPCVYLAHSSLHVLSRAWVLLTAEKSTHMQPLSRPSNALPPPLTHVYTPCSLSEYLRP